LEAGRLLVEAGDDTGLLDVPCGLLERLVCFGAVGVSAGVRSWALAQGIDMVFLSRRGSYLGQAWGGGDRTRVFRLRAQLAASDDVERSLVFGRAVVEAKVRKQAVVLRRLARREDAAIAAEAADLMIRLLPMLLEAGATEELMGVEGAAARAYFGALGVMMPEGLRFEGRSRQPPLDVVNAALSYGYAILAGVPPGSIRVSGCCTRTLIGVRAWLWT
jgi:CRISPR-associated protein Cas1